MSKKLALVVTFICLFLTVSCAATPRKLVEHEITFPQPSSALHTDIAPFTVKISLPERWEIQPIPEDADGFEFLWLGVDSVMRIVSDSGYVGAIGFNPYVLYEDEEENPKAIYAGLVLPNHYNFMIYDKYEEVKKTESSSVAITDVYYSAHIMQDNGMNFMPAMNRGILSYNSDLLAYIVVEFDSDLINDDPSHYMWGVITEKELIAIARSISFK